jgi:hypothetical protein
MASLFSTAGLFTGDGGWINSFVDIRARVCGCQKKSLELFGVGLLCFILFFFGGK